ncbi:flavin reductase family protein [Haladaptatus sp. DYSN1]|uniref:flavin reductase family protein n=1 Tax=unclassified Haladaptatus TaxID=2622732 RepID=UPI0024057A8A|nr:flavin reductase family protein [Haladaptatus sp. DYSN1]
MEIDPTTLDGTLYRTLAAGVVPRPIAWVSTRSEAGVDNLAPYSFFNVVSVDPPTIMFAPVDRGDDLKDTPKNVLDTEEFVVNVVTEEFATQMNESSATLPHGESEFDHAGLDRVASTKVAPPRVAGIKVAYECRLADFVDVGASSMVLGEVVNVYVDDSVTTGGKLDVEKLDAVGRLSGSWYAKTTDRFSLERPE